MRKSDKKIENRLIAALKAACEEALNTFDGFEWLTHTVNYQQFPDSLAIICVFDTDENLSKMVSEDNGIHFKALIEEKLQSADFRLKGIRKRIRFDSEEACEIEHQGCWSKRLG